MNLRTESLQSLQRDYRQTLSVLATRIEQLAQSLHRPGALEELRRVTHRLVGSGACYGYPRISELARAVEHADPRFEESLVPPLVGVMRTVAQEPLGSVSTAKKSSGSAVKTRLSRRVLLVDDDAQIASLVRHRLQAAGIAVDHASNGEEGLRRLTSGRRPYELLILDVDMPGINGYEVLARVRRLSSTANLPDSVLFEVARERDEATGAREKAG